MPVKPELRDQVAADILRRPDVTSRDMMGTDAYLVRGRMFAFWVADGLIARLPDHARQEFIDKKVGAVFQGPQGRGFGDWTRLELSKKEDAENVLEAVKAAYQYVRGGDRPKTKRKAKR